MFIFHTTLTVTELVVLIFCSSISILIYFNFCFSTFRRQLIISSEQKRKKLNWSLFLISHVLWKLFKISSDWNWLTSSPKDIWHNPCTVSRLSLWNIPLIYVSSIFLAAGDTAQELLCFFDLTLSHTVLLHVTSPTRDQVSSEPDWPASVGEQPAV